MAYTMIYEKDERLYGTAVRAKSLREAMGKFEEYLGKKGISHFGKGIEDAVSRINIRN